jgi:transposase InsO family protein
VSHRNARPPTSPASWGSPAPLPRTRRRRPARSLLQAAPLTPPDPRADRAADPHLPKLAWLDRSTSRDSTQHAAARNAPRVGYEYVHRAATALAELGIDRIERVMTGNALACRRSHAWRDAQTNGKAEGFNRTLTEEWAYAQPFTSSHHRAEALAEFLHRYNHHRAHISLGGKPPITRVNKGLSNERCNSG